MPKLLCCALLCVSAHALCAQSASTNGTGAAAATPPTAAASSGWGRVQALKPGTKLHIYGPKLKASCKFVAADDESLTCSGSGSKSRTIERTAMTTIRVPHRGRSTLAGFAIGFGGGAIAGAATCKKDDFIGPGGCAVLFGVPLGVVGAGIGAGTDFTRSTLYSTH